MDTQLATIQNAPVNLASLAPNNIGEAMQLAEIMSKAGLVPDHLKGKPADCLMIVMQAQRWGIDAFQVAQCTSVVHGRLCFEGKLVAAALYAMGAIEGRLEYDITGSGQTASIKVSGKPRGGTKIETVTGSVKDWRTFGKDKQQNNWDKSPEDMLVYRGTRQWARRYAPDAMLGVYTPDEMDEAQGTVTLLPPSSSRLPQPKADAELPPYPADKFEANAPAWRENIATGQRTPDQIIAMVSTKGVLSDEQTKAIRAMAAPVEQAA